MMRQSLSILVVDDNKDNADALAILLKLLGHEVTKCYEGKSAIEAVEASMPDLILLDLGMPNVSGLEVCRHIRQMPAGGSVTIAAQTAWDQDSYRHQTVAAGFDHHLVKPIDPRKLRELVQETCARVSFNDRVSTHHCRESQVNLAVH